MQLKLTYQKESYRKTAMYEQTPLYVNGTGGYRQFCTPSLLTSGAGTIMAFGEGRNSDPKAMGGDTGDIDVVLKRSFDNGRTWEPPRTIVRTGPDTDGNPAPLLDAETGTIWLFFCKNFTDGGEDKIIAGKAPRTVWITSSTNDGETWAEPREITDDVKDPSWTWYATGPCHGIQLRSGRLMMSCDHVLGAQDLSTGYHDVASSVAVLSASGYSHVIYSDDHGVSWHIGGSAQTGTNESVVVETTDGSLYLNCRNYVGERRRAFAWSYDGGTTFPETGYDDSLPSPICQASAVRFTDETTHDKNRVLFSNPASSTGRERMTVRISYDECRTWGAGKVLHDDHSAYSDLCIGSDMSIFCLFDRGHGSSYDGVTLAHFDLEWLTDGADSLS